MKKLGLLLLALLVVNIAFAHSWGYKRTNCWGFFSPRYGAFATINVMNLVQTGGWWDLGGRYHPTSTWKPTEKCYDHNRGCGYQTSYCLRYYELYDFGFWQWYGGNAGYTFSSAYPDGFQWAFWTNSYRIKPGVGQTYEVDSVMMDTTNKRGNSYSDMNVEEMYVDEATKTLTINNLHGQLSIMPGSNYFATIEILVVKQKKDLTEAESQDFEDLGNQLIFENVVASGQLMVNRDGAKAIGFLGEMVHSGGTIINDTAFGYDLSGISGSVNLDVDLKEDEQLTLVTYGDGGFDYSLVEVPSEILSKKIDLEKKNIVSIFPNPAFSTLNIEFTTTENTQVAVDILDARGMKVQNVYSGFLDAGMNTFKNVDISNLSRGLYIVRIMEGDKLTVQKFTVK